MKYWLVKSEPNAYSWDDLVRDGRTYWDGVRNYQARNNLKEMKIGDQILYYHSQVGLEVVGIATVVKEAYQDPSTKDDRWVAVDIEPLETLSMPISLKEIKAHKGLAEMALVKHSRLSVMPVTKREFSTISRLGRT